MHNFHVQLRILQYQMKKNPDFLKKFLAVSGLKFFNADFIQIIAFKMFRDKFSTFL
jgi:hypothetical protein